MLGEVPAGEEDSAGLSQLPPEFDLRSGAGCSAVVPRTSGVPANQGLPEAEVRCQAASPLGQSEDRTSTCHGPENPAAVVAVRPREAAATPGLQGEGHGPRARPHPQSGEVSCRLATAVLGSYGGDAVAIPPALLCQANPEELPQAPGKSLVEGLSSLDCVIVRRGEGSESGRLRRRFHSSKKNDVPPTACHSHPGGGKRVAEETSHVASTTS